MTEQEPETGPTQMFVYGTLKRGLANHHWLAGAVYGGERLLRGAQLYDLGPFPMAVASPAGRIHGELYLVSQACLAGLDQLEGVPRLFCRQRLPLDGGDLAWIYLGQPHQVRYSPLISSGLWSGPRQQRHGHRSALGWALALLMATAQGGIASGLDNRQLCLQWNQSHGSEKIALANAIGAQNLLTKVRRLAEAQAGDNESIYASNDIRRLCRML